MRTCPHCKTQIDVDVGMSRGTDGKLENSTPRIGDVTICLHCGELCEFGLDNVLIAITDEKKLKDINVHPDVIVAKALVSNAIHQGRSYEKQLDKMAIDVRMWCKNNPTLSPKIQRNSTSNIGIIATLSDAIESKLVSVNEDADKMLRELGWLDHKELMPTVFMTEAAIGLAFKNNVD